MSKKRQGRNRPVVAAREARGAYPPARSERRPGDVVNYGILMNFRGAHVTQAVGHKPNHTALRNLGVLRKWVQWTWISLSRNLEVKGKEAGDS